MDNRDIALNMLAIHMTLLHVAEITPAQYKRLSEEWYDDTRKCVLTEDGTKLRQKINDSEISELVSAATHMRFEIIDIVNSNRKRKK